MKKGMKGLKKKEMKISFLKITFKTKKELFTEEFNFILISFFIFFQNIF